MSAEPRCAWNWQQKILLSYHDREWGVPRHDDRLLFEMLILEGVQAGLNWVLVLQKRENYRRLFDGFAWEKIARYGEGKMTALLRNPAIIRNRLKIEAARANARAFLRLREECGSFDRYLWRFVDGKPIMNRWRSLKKIPTRTVESDALSLDLKRRGFTFVGSTICYAFMQAVGLVNDHTTDCYRHREILEKYGY